MLRFATVLCVCTILVGLLPQSASALDGTRKGFILGGGVGFGSSKWTIKTSAEEDSESKSGFGTDFKIGGGFTEQFLLYWHNRINWTSFSGSSGSDVTIVFGNSGIGGAYYFAPAAPAGFVMGQFGWSSIVAPFEDNVDSDTGVGFLVGGGYEFASHWSVEGTYGYGSPDTGVGGLDQNVGTFLVTINGLWY